MAGCLSRMGPLKVEIVFEIRHGVSMNTNNFKLDGSDYLVVFLQPRYM